MPVLSKGGYCQDGSGFPTGDPRSGNLKKLTVWMTTAKVTINVLAA